MADRGRRDGARRLGVLSAALAVRLLVAWVAFSGVDGIESLRNSVRVLGGTWAHTPYLPFIELWIWIAAKVTMATGLPLLFPYKLLPLVMDALIALLLFDTRGTRAGLLYAFAPIPIAVACLTAQWDAIWLYFLLLALVLGGAASGAAYVVSFLVKPIAAPLGVVLLPRTRRTIVAFVAGGVAVFAVYLVILYAIGWPLTKQTFLFMFEYAQRGVQLFGLPRLPVNRLWASLAALAVIAVLHARGRMPRDEAVLLFFAAVLGLSGLGPQYLAWIVPFAIYSGRMRFAAVFTLCAGMFLVLFYRLPFVNRLNVENLGAFGLLKPWGGWAPATGGETMRVVAVMLGNFVVPMVCLTFFGVGVVRAILRPVTPAPHQHSDGRRVAAPLLLAVVLLGMGTVWAAMRPPVRDVDFIVRAEQKIGAYDVVRYRGSDMAGLKVWIPRTGRAGLNTATLAAVWIVAWSVAAAMTKEERR